LEKQLTGGRGGGVRLPKGLFYKSTGKGVIIKRREPFHIGPLRGLGSAIKKRGKTGGQRGTARRKRISKRGRGIGIPKGGFEGGRGVMEGRTV